LALVKTACPSGPVTAFCPSPRSLSMYRAGRGAAVSSTHKPRVPCHQTLSKQLRVNRGTCLPAGNCIQDLMVAEDCLEDGSPALFWRMHLPPVLPHGRVGQAKFQCVLSPST
jgi:hypothetical protein